MVKVDEFWPRSFSAWFWSWLWRKKYSVLKGDIFSPSDLFFCFWWVTFWYFMISVIQESCFHAIASHLVNYRSPSILFWKLRPRHVHVIERTRKFGHIRNLDIYSSRFWKSLESLKAVVAWNFFNLIRVYKNVLSIISTWDRITNKLRKTERDISNEGMLLDKIDFIPCNHFRVSLVSPASAEDSAHERIACIQIFLNGYFSRFWFPHTFKTVFWGFPKTLFKVDFLENAGVSFVWESKNGRFQMQWRHR